MRSSRISCYNEQHTSQELEVWRGFCLLFSGKKGRRERLRRCRSGVNSDAGRPQAVTGVNEERKAIFKCRDLVLGADDDVIYLVLTTSYYRVFGNNIKPIGRLNHI